MAKTPPVFKHKNSKRKTRGGKRAKEWKHKRTQDRLESSDRAYLDAKIAAYEKSQGTQY